MSGFQMVSYQKLTSLNPWNYYFCVAGRIRCYLRRWSWSENCKRRVKCRIRPRYGTSQLDFFLFLCHDYVVTIFKDDCQRLRLISYIYDIFRHKTLLYSLNFRLNRFDFGVGLLTFDYWVLFIIFDYRFSIQIGS